MECHYKCVYVSKTESDWWEYMTSCIHIYIWRKGRCIYVPEKIRYMVCVCVYVCLAACLSKQLGIASRRTGLLLCELCVKLAPYRSFDRTSNAFSQLAAMYEKETHSEGKGRETKACVAINSIMHAALFFLLDVSWWCVSCCSSLLLSSKYIYSFDDNNNNKKKKMRKKCVQDKWHWLYRFEKSMWWWWW